MRILILSSTCSKPKYEEIYNKRFKPMLDTNQKFFLSLIGGLQKIDDIKVDCVTTLPISHSCYPGVIIKGEEEIVDGVFYHYCGCVNLPYVRTLTVGRNMKKYVKKYLKQHAGEEIVVICDALIAEANAIVKILKKKKIQSVAVVTDVPSVVNEMFGLKKSLKTKLATFYGNRALKLLHKFDKYVFLTEQMNELCNPNDMPYMIMECLVTPTELEKENEQRLADLPVCLYAGKLYKDCGVLTFASCAEKLKGKCEIWLYGGHSDCESELKDLQEKNDNLKIHGILPLNEILKIEQKSSILVNPRPGVKDFTKYSFPSKTAEYMMMGVPVLMHRLPGVPSEYDEYVNYIENDSAEAIGEAILKILNKSQKERDEQGLKAREFIIKNKNAFVQAQRVIDFIKG